MLNKKGINLAGMKVETLYAIIVADKVWTSMGFNLVVTSVLDGVHSENSLHYSGYAVDLRTYYFDHEELHQAYSRLKKRLGEQYDVVLEKDHIHVEFDPDEG